LRCYELCLILHADIIEDALDSILNNLTDIISKHKGRLLKIDKWGKKNFKYPIKKNTKGIYCFLYFQGNNEVLREIDRSIRFNESIVRYNNIRIEDNSMNEDSSPAASEANASVLPHDAPETADATTPENSETN